MNALTREEILEKYTKVQIYAELDKYCISYEKNLTNDELLDIYFKNTYEIRKVYTTDDLDKFSVSTIYQLCKRHNCTKYKFKGFVPQYQKPNLIADYISYVRNLSDEECEELESIKYPENNRFVHLDLIKTTLDEVKMQTYTSQNVSLPELVNAIVSRCTYFKTPSQNINLIDFLYYATNDILCQILEEIGNYPTGNLTLDDKICLITWHILYEKEYIFKKDCEFSIYLGYLNSESVKTRFIGEYKYPEDMATMYWILNTQSIPPITINHLNLRYQELIKLTGPQICKLSYAYQPLPTSKYRYIALAEKSLLENFLLCLDDLKNIPLIKQRLGIIMPPNLKISEQQYLQSNLIHYQKILTRGKNVGLPPAGRSTLQDLEWYTDAELFNFYDLKYIQSFDNRIDLLQRILFYLKSKHYWHTEYKKSRNLDMHVIMGEPRIQEPDNDIICYGNLIYYRAYNIDELSESFRHYEDDGFRFKLPDGNGYTPDFTVPQIQELIKFLVTCFGNKYIDLIEKLEQGILFSGNINSRIEKIRGWYTQDTEMASAIQKFTVMLFLMSMKMKKWKGVGTPFPTEWKEQVSIEVLKTRDANTEMALSEYIQFIDSLEGKIRVKICEIPRISYKFKSGEIKLGYESVNSILEKVSNGDFCLGHASDILVQTSYILWTKVMKYDLKEINKHIKEELKSLEQSDFDPMLLGVSGHFDPNHRLQEF